VRRPARFRFLRDRVVQLRAARACVDPDVTFKKNNWGKISPILILSVLRSWCYI
jgi:hypothetical protein